MAQKPRGLHPEEIKARLRILYGSLAAFSVLIGRGVAAVSKVIATPGYSVPIEREIAKALGMKPEEVWPDRYHEDGTPVSFTVDRTPTALPRADQRAKAVAA
ncbi:putative transcriptional regulator [Gluconacetobacter sacchari DSM 12717]|uniref:Transcriptional regulator n=2 Tax=Gluconacetobacter sacchari TaxID=92759 RepID=A0A7W4NLR8_9PROT|nr:helix-turn-helix domain-containing protein [Gluconacetobacter sacchari]MBB2160122.1 transcriptional regulator [Gluconacetobacter sacchari]GBQ25032.1 putative transcriptional regulator [Gluconacetobacter sacchari DSM 12717]